MTFLGVFRDDFYNAVNVLTALQFASTTQASGTLSATVLAGATECYVSQSGATALTTDNAVNIIAQIQQAVATAIKASLAGGAGFASGVAPPNGVPNLFNVTWTVYVRNTNAGTLTLTAGTGVTITGTNTLATAVERQYMVTVTSPTTVTLQDLGGSTLQ